jgi:hypothetical protein
MTGIKAAGFRYSTDIVFKSLKSFCPGEIEFDKADETHTIESMSDLRQLLHTGISLLDAGNGASEVAKHIQQRLASIIDPARDYELAIKELLEKGLRQGNDAYAGRNQHESAAVFLQRKYGDYIRAGVLYKDQLRKLDPKLVLALNKSNAVEEMAKLGIYLPVKSERVRKLVSEFRENSEATLIASGILRYN